MEKEMNWGDGWHADGTLIDAIEVNMNEIVSERCGVFGIYAPGEDVARITFFGLFALQHRGQESAGITVSNGDRLLTYKGMGLASQIFTEDVLARLRGYIAIGHNRYSTTGSSVLTNTQPIEGRHRGRQFAVGHNGNIVNAYEIRRELERMGLLFETSSDTEVIVKLIESHEEFDFESAVVSALLRLRGAFSLVIMTADKLLAARDPWGVRPLSLGILNSNHYIVASESCAFNIVGARYVRELQPGELIIIDENGIRELRYRTEQKQAFCIFEFVYLARPDSYMLGRTVHMARRRMGNLLAQEHPANADIVIPVPLSGVPAAIGYAEVSRIPYAEGFVYNRYIQRTFIQPDQRMREMGVRLKITPIREVLAGKRVVVVEDSIVRGTTIKSIVSVLREAGAREVHLRVSSPPYRYPCFYGIDTPTRQELIAAQVKDIDQIREFVGADSLGYLSLENLVKAVGLAKKCFCTACFDGRYPIAIPRALRLTKFLFECVEKERQPAMLQSDGS
ncbi:MAG: amidophosphoribosyltransferase [Armatimonadota bacterium]|nr:amidophosphoribosyltransferase [Armatimonadota bacterium]MCX7778448.1 amidophosphoribosyltransferase [Armatimonadota bacterium]MDW8026036.1 amidophosphoribosyltransferase [Armatimonadota bacterium]